MKNRYLKKLIISLVLFLLCARAIAYFVGNPISSWPEADQRMVLLPFRILIACVAIYFIRKEGFFNRAYFFKNNFANVAVCVLLVGISIFETLRQIPQQAIAISNYDHYSYFLRCMGIGFMEEVVFRVLIFGYVCAWFYRPDAKSHTKEIIVTGLCFGSLHLQNAIYVETIYDVVGILNQVLFAALMGIILQLVFYRFNNIILLVTVHTIVDYNNIRNTALFKIPKPAGNIDIAGELTESLLITLGFAVLIVLPMLLLMRHRKNHLIDYSKIKAKDTSKTIGYNITINS